MMGKGERFEALKKALSEFSLEEALKLETFDRQYRALQKLFNKLESAEPFLKLVLINALLSYQLPMRGEAYWEKFAEFFSENPNLDRFEEFLKFYNNRYLSAKLRRLKKVLAAVGNLSEGELKGFCRNPEGLLNFLSEKLKQPKGAKTLVFAVKMFLYACRIAGLETATAPFDTDIPLDARLKKISDDPAFWRSLAEAVGIPPLHLDVVVWTTLGGKRNLEAVEDPELRKKLSGLRKVLEKILRGK